MQGGVYLECGKAPYGGVPLEFYIMDSPHPLSVDCKTGAQLWERDGVYHVVDYIGQTHYPFASDFIEEAKAYGISRRIPATFPLELLTAESRLVLVHARGRIKNAEAYAGHLKANHIAHRGTCALLAKSQLKGAKANPLGPDVAAIAGNEAHMRRPDVACNFHWYVTADPTACLVTYSPPMFPDRLNRALYRAPGEVVKAGKFPTMEPHKAVGEIQNVYGREIVRAYGWKRQHGSVTYDVYPIIKDAPKPEWQEAIVAVVPITNVSVIQANDGSHHKAFERVKFAVGNLITVSQPKN